MKQKRHHTCKPISACALFSFPPVTPEKGCPSVHSRGQSFPKPLTQSSRISFFSCSSSTYFLLHQPVLSGSISAPHKCPLPSPSLRQPSPGFRISHKLPPHVLPYSHSQLQNLLSTQANSVCSKHTTVYSNQDFPNNLKKMLLSRSIITTSTISILGPMAVFLPRSY